MLAIRNFGHFWSRGLVEWGARGSEGGKLRGYFTYNRKPFVVDFREQIAIYVLFNDAREVVYVGQTGSSDRRLYLRLRDHTRDHLRDRWTYFSWFGMRLVNWSKRLSDGQKPRSRAAGTNADALNEIEAILLQLFEPRLNKQGPKWGDIESYLQYVAKEWEDAPDTGDVEDTLVRMDKTISDLANEVAALNQEE